MTLIALNSQPVPGWTNSSNIKSEFNPENNYGKSADKAATTLINSVKKSADSSESQTKNDSESQTKNNPAKLSPEEKSKVNKLKQRDREVRAHEMAHQAVGGQYAGSASYSYTTGPDNKRYAVGGSVSIDTSPEKEPEQTIKKAEQIKRAATAPANPSSADLQIAAKAARMAMQARSELNQENSTEIDSAANFKAQPNNKYLINKRENSYQKLLAARNGLEINSGFAA